LGLREGDTLSVRVWQVAENYEDGDQNRIVVTYYIRAYSDDDAVSRAASMSTALRQLCRLRFLWQSLSIYGDAQAEAGLPQGTFDKQLVINCQSDQDPLTGRSYLFKIRVPDPDPGYLTADGSELDLSSPLVQAFKGDFLVWTTDIRGTAFSRLLPSRLIQY